MTDENITIWAALADAKRRDIVNLLQEKPRTTGEISEHFDVSRFAVMKHLKVLEQANLIKTRREGRQRWNMLNDDLARFLRTRLTGDEGDSSYQLVDILGLFPADPSDAPLTGPAAETVIEQTVLLPAAPPQVYQALTGDLDAWWSLRLLAHSQVKLEPYVNGRFYEAFNTAGHGVLYATVTCIRQFEELRFRGTGELTERMAGMFVPDNFIHLTLEPQANGTQLTLTHRLKGGLNKFAEDVYHRQWHVLLNQHLKSFVARGIPYQPG